MSFTTLIISEASDLDLIRCMKLRQSDSALAEEAFEEFYRRYSTRLLAAAHKHTFYLGSHFDPENHVIETFLKIYEGPGDFESEFPPEGLTAEQIQENVEFWIFRVFGSKLDEYRDEQSRKNKLLNSMLKSNAPQWGSSGVDLIYGYNAFMELFPTLEQGAKDILLTSYQYYNEFSGNCEIPDEQRNNLCERLKISPENLRKRRQRLVKQLVDLARSKMDSDVLHSLKEL